MQRYRCKARQRTFNTLTGTPLARLRHKDKWLAYEQALITGMSIRAAAAHCAIAKNTSFKWRYRFLQRPAKQQARQVQGVAEADETFFIDSCKGQRHLDRPARKRGRTGAARSLGIKRIPVLVVRDRHGATADCALAGVSTQDIAAVLTPLLTPEVILCTDGAFAYRRLAQREGWTHHAVNVTRGIYQRGPYHIQNVNAYLHHSHSRLKGWMERFHGVARRYLTHYLGWRRMLEHFGASLTPETGLRAALYVERPGQQVNVTKIRGYVHKWHIFPMFYRGVEKYKWEYFFTISFAAFMGTPLWQCVD